MSKFNKRLPVLLAALKKRKNSVFDDHYRSCSDSFSGLSAPTEKGESSAAGMEQDRAVADMDQDEMKQEDRTPVVFAVSEENTTRERERERERGVWNG